MARLWANGVHIRSDLLRLNAAPKCCVTDYFQLARPHACRCSLAVGLVRYAKQDTKDFAAVLRLGAVRRSICFAFMRLEQWFMGRCCPMGHTGYQPPQKQQLCMSSIVRFNLGRTVCLWCGGRVRPAVLLVSGGNRPIKIPAPWFRRRTPHFLLKLLLFIYCTYIRETNLRT